MHISLKNNNDEPTNKNFFNKIPLLVRVVIYFLLLACIAMVQPLIPIHVIRMILAAVFQLLIVGMIGLIIFRTVIKWLREFKFDDIDKKRIYITLTTVTSVGIILLVVYSLVDQTIKVYDTGINWSAVIDGKNLMSQSIPEYLINLKDSMSQSYNGLAAFPLIFLSWVIGTSYAALITSSFLIYYLPTCLLIVIFAMRITNPVREKGPGGVSFIICFLVCVLSADFFLNIVQGNSDIAGVFFIGLMLNILYKWDMYSINIKQNAIIGLTMICMVFMKSWYLYFVLSFFAVFIIFHLLKVFTLKEDKGASLGFFLANIVIISAVFVGVAAIVNPSIFTMLLDTATSLRPDFEFAYILDFAWNIVCNHSILMLGFSLVGAGMLLIYKQTRLISVIMIFTMITTIIFAGVMMATYVQHSYLVLPILLIFTCIVADYGVQYAYVNTKPILAGGVMALVTLNFLFAYVPFMQSFSYIASPFTTELHATPQPYTNAKVIDNLVNDADDWIGNSQKKLYVVNSRSGISKELLSNVKLPKKTDAAPYALISNTVDTRDGFPSQMFLADYVVFADPYKPESGKRQQVEYQISDALLSDPNISEFYNLKQLYHASDFNIIAFEKIGDSSKASMDLLSEKLKKLYPNDAFIYEPDYFIGLFKPEGKTKFEYNHYWEKRIIFDKSPQEDITFSWNTQMQFSSLSFNLTNYTEGLSMIVENQNGIISDEPLIEGADILYNFYIEGSEFVKVTIKDNKLDRDYEYQVIMGHNKDGLKGE